MARRRSHLAALAWAALGARAASAAGMPPPPDPSTLTAVPSCPAGSQLAVNPATPLTWKCLFCTDAKGRRQGPELCWHPNDSLATSGSNRDGRQVGWSFVWDEHGVLLSERELDGEVMLARRRLPGEGPPRASRPGDAVHPCPKGTFIAGSPPHAQWCEKPRADGAYVQEGPFIDWWSPGVVAHRRSYRDARAVGESWSYYPDGKPQSVRDAEHWSGAQQAWYRNGRRELERIDRADGVTVTRRWNRDGSLESQIDARGRETLRRVFYYDEGRPSSEELRSGGKVEGLQRKWWPNGQLWSEEDKHSGRARSTTREWSPRGELMRVATHEPDGAMHEENYRVWMDDPPDWNLPRVNAVSPAESGKPDCPRFAHAFEDRGAGFLARGCAIGLLPVFISQDFWTAFFQQREPRVVASGGVLHGPLRIWNANGVERAEIHFRWNKYDGQVTRWLDDGTLFETTTWVAGEQNGPFARWARTGAPGSCGTLHPGKPLPVRDGVWWHCHASGLCDKREEYQNGIKNGRFLELWPNGQTRHETEYRDGKLDGSDSSWDIEGRLLSQGHYAAGEKTGPWLEDRDHAQGSYDRGRRIGEWRTFWPDGTAKARGSYAWCAEPTPHTDGCKTGEWTYWGENGEPEHPTEAPASVSP